MMLGGLMRDETEVNVMCERELLAISSARMQGNEAKGHKLSNHVAYICYH